MRGFYLGIVSLLAVPGQIRDECSHRGVYNAIYVKWGDFGEISLREKGC
jgi:hypothetical protein